jgi:hypothetical protein
MAKHYIYPRGFVVVAASDDSDVKRTVGDDEVDYLYRVFVNREAGYDSWEFRSETIKVAKRLMGLSLTGWAGRHADSRFLNINARAFIKDTVRFLETGRRSMSGRNWLDLLETDPSPLPVALRDNATELPEALVRDTMTYIQRWLSHTGGFEDLLTSLAIMYGSGLPSNKQRIGVDHISPKNPKVQALAKVITRNVQPAEENVFL